MSLREITQRGCLCTISISFRLREGKDYIKVTDVSGKKYEFSLNCIAFVVRHKETVTLVFFDSAVGFWELPVRMSMHALLKCRVYASFNGGRVFGDYDQDSYTILVTKVDATPADFEKYNFGVSGLCRAVYDFGRLPDLGKTVNDTDKLGENA